MVKIEGRRGRKAPKKVMVELSWLEMWKALPNDVQKLIVNKLSMLEVFRIGTVCKDFSAIWKGLRNLDFGKNVMKLIDERGFNFGDITSRITSGLNGHVDSFDLYVSRAEHTKQVERWVKFLSEKHIKNLSINNEYYRLWRNSTMVPDILKCTALQCLSLTGCRLTPLSDFQGFGNLVSLKLDSVTITHNLLNAIIARSPLLEELHLYFSHENTYGPVVINSCLLKTFHLETNDYVEYWNLCLKGKCSNLKVAFIYSDIEIPAELPGNNKLNQFSNLLPNIEILTLTGVALMTLAKGNAPARFDRLSACLQNLKLLDIRCFELNDIGCVACVFCIIRSSPNLQSLSLAILFSAMLATKEEYDIFYENQGSVELSSSLLNFYMDINGADNYIDLLMVKTILRCCPALETVCLLNDPELLDTDEELSIIETILGYPRPESTVIKFDLAWEDNNNIIFNRHEEGLYWISD